MQGAKYRPECATRELVCDATLTSLLHWLIEGKPTLGKHTDLTAYLSEMPYQLPPIPNLMFMRDPAAVVATASWWGNMAFPARMREALLMRYVYSLHPQSGRERRAPTALVR